MKKWKVLKDGTGQSKITTDEVIKTLLENRKISTKKAHEQYINPSLDSVNFDNVGINVSEVDKTIERIKKAIEKNEAIVVYGDYDVDGICGTAILWETIYSFFKNVHPYIPHRVDEGYGLSESGIKNILSENKNVKLIITVDNGIVAYKALEFAKSQGIDVVITDHHVSGKAVPEAYSVVHTTKLCGTSVAYLLSQRIEQEFKFPHNDSHLELVALATVADLVPLKEHNRTLLKYGLKSLRKTQRKGLLALLQEAKIKKDEIDVYHIGHIVAPRLNASGRISHAMDALRLICTTDSVRAQKLARILEETNKNRQTLTFDSAAHAKEAIDKDNLENILIVSEVMYDQGVIGLIASKLVEEFYRPSIAISVGDEISKGSARSISGVNIIELIRSVSEFLKEAGGHPMAAGFSIETKNLESFKAALEKKAKSVVSADLFERILYIDMELLFENITPELHESIQALAPFGMENPSPVFLTRGVTIAGVNRVGKNKEHVQVMCEKDANFLKGILFRYEKDDLRPGVLADIVYSVEKNEWNGKVSIEVRLKDIRVI